MQSHRGALSHLVEDFGARVVEPPVGAVAMLRSLHQRVTDLVQDELRERVVGVELLLVGDVQRVTVEVHVRIAAPPHGQLELACAGEPDVVEQGEHEAKLPQGPWRSIGWSPTMPTSWLLIAVLESTFPLEEAVTLRLYHAAMTLHAEAGSVEKIQGDLMNGQVRRLGKTMLLGAIGGPAFEADLDTPRGSGHVRFVLTPEGLEHAGVPETRAPRSLPS